MAKDYVLTVMSLDRIGIVAGITRSIFDLGGNIDAISQTVMRGYFTIIVTVRFEGDVSKSALAEAVRSSGAPGELEVSVKERAVLDPKPVVRDGDRFVLTIMGADKKGIIKAISSYLASRNINIEDLYAYTEEDRFVLISELQLPRNLDVESVKMDIEGLRGLEGTSVNLQHENIFTATNRVEFSQETI